MNTVRPAAAAGPSTAHDAPRALPRGADGVDPQAKACGTPVGWPLRTWFAVELFFAIAATLSVALDPALTASHFAWTIKPPVMGALFGAFYIALLPVMLLAIAVRRWEMARVFVLPGLCFTLAELVVTLLHWDRFAVGSRAFDIWFASYLLPPPVFFGCYLWQQSQVRAAAASAGAFVAQTDPLPAWQRRVALVLGGLLTLEALIGLVWPTWFSRAAPWPVSPLNGRALAGFLLLLGLLLLSIAHENQRDRVRLVSPFLVLLLPVSAFQVARFADQVDWGQPRVAVMAGVLAAVMVLGLSLVRGSWRRVLR